MTALELTRNLVRSCLNLNDAEPLSEDTYLVGGFPEFDSLTIATLIEQIEVVEAVGSNYPNNCERPEVMHVLLKCHSLP